MPLFGSRPLSVAALALAMIALLPGETGAAPVRALTASAAAAAVGTLAPGTFRWLSDGPWDGPVYMVISIDRQMVHVYNGDALIAMASVSTGKRGHSTPKGEFPILQKQKFHRSNIYSNAPMPFMQRLTWDGIALHAGHNPGFPASHGCIRLPYAFAQQLFGITRIGTPVEVTADRLSPALKFDSLVLGDPQASVVAFTPRQGPAVPAGALPQPNGAARGVPYLEIDPGIFAPHLKRP